MTKTQQRRAWKSLTHMLHQARHGHAIDSQHGLEMAEALAPHWPSFDRTLSCIVRRMRELSEMPA